MIPNHFLRGTMSLSESSMYSILAEHRKHLSNCTLTCPSGHSFKEEDIWTVIEENKEETVICPKNGESFQLSSIMVVKPYSKEKELDDKINKSIEEEVNRIVQMQLSSKIQEATAEDKKQIRNLSALNLQYSDQFSSLNARKKELEANVEKLTVKCDGFQSHQRKLISLAVVIAFFAGYFFRNLKAALFNKV